MLIFSIIVSVLVVMLDSINELHVNLGQLFYLLEWFFTLLFSVEYLLRLNCVNRPLKYALSFYGIVDLLSILPTYLSLFITGGQYLPVIRVLRVLRIFRVLKLVHYVGEAGFLLHALRASRRKISLFVLSVFLLTVVIGSVMYPVEGPDNGFTSIPRSVYWAIVTMTTVGYGDISSKTNLGQTFASLVIMLGYGIIAIPTGIVTAELAFAHQITTQSGLHCLAEGHTPDAKYCKFCGAELNPESNDL